MNLRVKYFHFTYREEKKTILDMLNLFVAKQLES